MNQTRVKTCVRALASGALSLLHNLFTLTRARAIKLVAILTKKNVADNCKYHQTHIFLACHVLRFIFSRLLYLYFCSHSHRFLSLLLSSLTFSSSSSPSLQQSRLNAIRRSHTACISFLFFCWSFHVCSIISSASLFVRLLARPLAAC